jgi:hypothetical protein
MLPLLSLLELLNRLLRFWMVLQPVSNLYGEGTRIELRGVTLV